MRMRYREIQRVRLCLAASYEIFFSRGQKVLVEDIRMALITKQKLLQREA